MVPREARHRQGICSFDIEEYAARGEKPWKRKWKAANTTKDR